MSDADPADPVVLEEDNDPEPLSLWSRVAAGSVGVALCASGAVAVFRTDNQAGCVALLLIGAVFALLAIAGNPLQALGHGDTQMRFAVQKRRREALETISEAPPEEARRALAVLQAVDPGAPSDSTFLYESARADEGLIRQRLLHIFADSAIQSATEDRGVDFYMHRPVDVVLGVDVRFRPRLDSGSRRAIPRTVIDEISGRSIGSVVPVLLVSNHAISNDALNALSHAQASGVKLEYVQWRDERDDGELRNKAQILIGDAI
ncbi:hypothetical protein ACWDCB_03090 [Streptomyces sp. NPDC001178]